MSLKRKVKKKRALFYLEVPVLDSLDQIGFWLRKGKSEMVNEALKLYKDHVSKEHFNAEEIPVIPRMEDA